MKNFHQIQMPPIDVAPLLSQLSSHPALWNSDDSWTSNKPEGIIAVRGVDTIVLRRALGLEWTRPIWMKYLSAAEPIVLDVMRAVPGEHLGNVIITRLWPGQEIAPHVHVLPSGKPFYFHRYQIPLSVYPGCLFHCDGESLYMEPGTAWAFDDTRLHSVMNGSDRERISMFVDIRPFDRAEGE